MHKERVVGVGRLLFLFLAAGLAPFLLAARLWAGEPALRLVSPPDGVWVSQERLFLAGSGGGTAQTVRISGVNLAKGEAVPVGEGGVFGAPITLARGMNTIKVAADQRTVEVRLFYTPDPQKNPPPQDFKRFYLHSQPAVLNCQECHRLRKGEFDFAKIIPARANCTDKCHQDKGRAKHVHGPVGGGVCISCHSPHGTRLPAFVERSGPSLCTACHEVKKEEFGQKVVHSPVEEGCLDCHDPHESGMRYQLKGEGDSLSGLCYNCHEAAIFKRESQHSPVAEGDCIACHRPHSSAHAKLLIAPAEGGELCFQCHEDRKADFNLAYVHAPAQENCADCHDPHSAKARYMLKEEGGALCAKCHQEYSPKVYEAIKTATVKHPPVADGKCVSCHRPHSSAYAGLLKESMEKLCFSCHGELGETVAASKNRHGPVQSGDCAACHNVHGSKFTKLLARFYPLNFYNPYVPENYDLCFGCHNKDVARNKTTETLTNFRDGSYNLHYFHVNNQKGRTCTACHDPHASNQAKHIRYEVPFGAWSYPINITKSEFGGTCVVGCHAPKEYNRKTPKLRK